MFPCRPRSDAGRARGNRRSAVLRRANCNSVRTAPGVGASWGGRLKFEAEPLAVRDLGPSGHLADAAAEITLRLAPAARCCAARELSLGRARCRARGPPAVRPVGRPGGVGHVRCPRRSPPTWQRARQLRPCRRRSPPPWAARATASPVSAGTTSGRTAQLGNRTRTGSARRRARPDVRRTVRRKT